MAYYVHNGETTLNTPTLANLRLAAVALVLIAGAPSSRAADVSTAMQPIAGTLDTPPQAVANRNILALNTAMFELYGDAARVFQQNILNRHPVILGMFSGAGGRLILYRPGQAPLEASQVPAVYQLLKSLGHSTLAMTQVVAPYLDNAANQAWRAPMLAFRSRMASALETLDQSEMPEAWRANSRAILENNIAFMDAALAKGIITAGDLEAYGARQRPLLAHAIAWAAQTQVAHWMGVLEQWKTMLGADWDKTYAASNTIYVARQNNIIFSVLAQFFGAEAINDRLLLIETISFTSTQADLLESLTRIIADRSVGSIFFGNYRVMDYELMGGDARAAIIAETARRGMQPVLPPAVPFGSRQWPMLVTTGSGPTSLAELP